MSALTGNSRMESESTGKSLFYPKRMTVAVPRPTLCCQCKRPVFAAEAVSAAGTKYHKMCLKCSNCSRLLDSTTLTEHKNVLFCHSCYSKCFGLEALRCASSIPKLSGGDKVYVPMLSKQAAGRRNERSGENALVQMRVASHPTVIDYRDDLKASSVTKKILSAQQAEVCATCNGRVYIAERVTMAGQAYHKLCFKCNDCKSSLSAGKCCDNYRGDIFCRACYTKRYGPVGVGRGIQGRTNEALNTRYRM